MKKQFLMAFAGLVTVAGIAACATTDVVKPYEFPTPERVAGQKSVLELRVAPIQNVRVGFVGLGARGGSAIPRYLNIEGATIVALCDVREGSVKSAQEKITKAGKPAAKEYVGEDAWKKLCEDPNVDLVYICTQWDLHTPVALYAMDHGKHVASEVPVGLTVEDCWKLVDKAEQTQKHCMMIENCNYDFFEMAVLNMAQKGKLGEIVHTEGAYIHDLRGYHYSETGYYNMWRLRECQQRTGCLYPTHGIGPIAHVMNIHRGDRMKTLVSMSSDQFGMSIYAKEKNSKYKDEPVRLGDMNTTLIRTAKGKSIMLQHDVTSPRPYSRLFTISGTKGFAQKYPKQQLAFEPNAHGALNDDKMKEVLEEYKHPIVKEIGEVAKKVGGHGGMDFIMDYRLIYCLNHGLPLDQDVYDGAEWSAIVELSQKSIEMGMAPIEFPDFTRGDWKKLSSVKYYTKGE